MKKATHSARKTWWFVALGCVALALGVVALRQLRLPPPAPPVVTPPASAPEPPRPITLTFVGDIMLSEGVGKVAKQHGVPYLFAGVKKQLTADDLTIGNLECAVSTRGAREEKTYTFRADPALLPGLRKSGIEAVTLANNHALDFGRQALLDTLVNLRKAGIVSVGAGVDAEEAYRPALLTVGEQRVALLGASRVLPTDRWAAGEEQSGIASAYDPARLLEEIRRVRPNADLVVVYFHWGRERKLSPERYQRLLARQCIDAGADLIIGSHPHVPQGFEYYRGKLIVYSLGNFVFNTRTKSTMMVQTTFREGKLQSATAIPCTYAAYRPRVATKAALRRPLLAFLRKYSFGVTVGADGVLSEKASR